ncbi:MAG: 2,5-didehydrogluconate reductase [Firmicutes bacterium]|nr:2,5-didehydrogluconate reductase [Bacillota bacterium]
MENLVLHNGVKMPILGFGVYQITDFAECERSVLDALAIGYRLIDTAQAYQNEEAVGSAIAKSGISRDKIFVTSKVWISNGGYERAKASIDESLNKMSLDYLDLMLIHQPFNDYYGTYHAMEDAYKAGKLRAIGVANFYPDRLIDLCQFVEVAPMVNQVETHVFDQQVKAREIMDKYHVVHQSWGPFAEGRNNFFTNQILKKIGEKYGKSVPQTALRYLIQRGIGGIPKSVHKERMEQNFDVFDFSLAEADMREILQMDTGESLFFSHYDPETVEYITRLKR